MERTIAFIVSLSLETFPLVLIIGIIAAGAVEKYRAMRRQRRAKASDDFDVAFKVRQIGVTLRHFSQHDMMTAEHSIGAYEVWEWPYQYQWYENRWIWSTNDANSARDYAMAFDAEADAARHYLRTRDLRRPQL